MILTNKIDFTNTYPYNIIKDEIQIIPFKFG